MEVRNIFYYNRNGDKLYGHQVFHGVPFTVPTKGSSVIIPGVGKREVAEVDYAIASMNINIIVDCYNK